MERTYKVACFNCNRFSKGCRQGRTTQDLQDLTEFHSRIDAPLRGFPKKIIEGWLDEGRRTFEIQ
jgi:hypothetical protein